MNFLRQTAIRLGYAIALLLAVVVLNFVLIHIAPGDIADTIAGDMGGATEEVMAQIRADYGLDKPFLVQLGLYMGNVVQLDFGYSFFFNTPVTSLIAERLPATLLLVFSAQLLALVIGVVLGVISAQRPNGMLRYRTEGVAATAVCAETDTDSSHCLTMGNNNCRPQRV